MPSREGLIDVASERFSDSERKPIKAHLDDFIASMKAKGCDEKHTRSTRTYLKRIIEVARIEHLSDLTPSAATLALGAIEKKHKLSARSMNAHATAIKSLARWAWKDGRVRPYELGNIGRRNEEADRRYVRRPLTDTELRTLLSKTRTAPLLEKDERSRSDMVLHVGCQYWPTPFRACRPSPRGLRDRGAIPHCSPGWFPHQERLRSRATLAPELGCRVAPLACVPSPLEAPCCITREAAQMLHADLRRCGIEPVDAQGRVVDTHSLRHGYISALARAGVPIKVAQTLARHSEPEVDDERLLTPDRVRSSRRDC